MARLATCEALLLADVDPLGGAGIPVVAYLAAIAAHRPSVPRRRPLCLSFALAVFALATTFAAQFATALATSAFALSPRFSPGTKRNQQLCVVLGTQFRNLSFPASLFIAHRPLHALIRDNLSLRQE